MKIVKLSIIYVVLLSGCSSIGSSTNHTYSNSEGDVQLLRQEVEQLRFEIQLLQEEVTKLKNKEEDIPIDEEVEDKEYLLEAKHKVKITVEEFLKKADTVPVNELKEYFAANVKFQSGKVYFGLVLGDMAVSDFLNIVKKARLVKTSDVRYEDFGRFFIECYFKDKQSGEMKHLKFRFLEVDYTMKIESIY